MGYITYNPGPLLGDMVHTAQDAAKETRGPVLTQQVAAIEKADAIRAGAASALQSLAGMAPKLTMRQTGVQALNPKAWLVALAGVGLFVLPQAEAGQALLRFCAVSLLACLIGVGAWALLGQWLARWLRTPGRQQAFQRLLALLLAFSVAGMLA